VKIVKGVIISNFGITNASVAFYSTAARMLVAVVY
jgi:hypothetical protein